MELDKTKRYGKRRVKHRFKVLTLKDLDSNRSSKYKRIRF